MRFIKSQKEKIISLALSVTLLTVSAAPVWAEDLEEQLADLQRQAEAQQEVTNEAAAKVENYSEQLRQVQEQLRAATSDYNTVKDRLDEVEGQISDNTELLEKTESELKEKNKTLEKRVRDIYINGQISYIDVLFGAKDFSDFMTRMDVLTRIIKKDYDLIMKVKEDRQTILTARNQLQQDEKEAEALVADAEAKKSLVEEKESEQQELLDQAVYDKETSERAYEELLAASEEVANMIRRSQMSSSYSGASPGSGGMIWPLNGPITSEYGWRTHPIFGTERYHSGLDIGGDYGLPIYAAASGTVIYAGWISGYGYAVILDHGGGITTLYGHNEELLVSEGQSVSQGQAIAMCGSTGNSTGPHCHFEVRENGEPVSPYGYL